MKKPRPDIEQRQIPAAKAAGRGGSKEASSSPLDRAEPAPDSDPSQRIDLEAGTVLQAKHRYRLIRRLGIGSFGSVYHGECLDACDGQMSGPPPDVAIKVLGSTDRLKALNALKRELAALRRVGHPRIPTLHDFCLDGPVAFAVMEYFPAGSLADNWSFLGRLDVDQTWRLISDLLGALSAAHQASILHLDVKPSNVLLDGQGGFVLTDFGVAHTSRMSKGLLLQGQIPIGLGTHGYRAPEQANQKTRAFDLRTDLWGVGATAWAAFTGIDLNQRRDVLRRAEDGCIYGLQRLSDVHLACPPPLEEIIMGMLFLDPQRRPGGAAEILSRVKAVAGGYGMGAQPAAAAARGNASGDEIQHVIDNLADPLWASICRAPGFDRYLAKFEDSEVIAAPSDQSHHTHLLLSGKIRIEDGPDLVEIVKDEGSFVGAISTLTGADRRATLRAEGTVWTCIFNEAELEQFISCNPSVAVRMLRSMAIRIAGGEIRHSD
ncbi:MAG: protein kinase [Deltaproteobacteria bacterium]|nr:protein kinase [Deltaproteobacteria bacterium]MBW2390930.1 protein kinase [Deltaproteobacteria bacterium]